jgi:hypothetical protein
MDQAVADKLSFSTVECDVFTATAATIDLFIRFLAVPPELGWGADYPPVPQPQEPVPTAESTEPQDPPEPGPTGGDRKTSRAKQDSVQEPPSERQRDVAAVAGAQAIASVGNIIIDLGSLAGVGRQSSGPAVGQAGQQVPGGLTPEETQTTAAAPDKWQSIAEIEEQIKKLAPTDCSILFLGETGTGKEFFARKVRDASARKDKPFVAVNCATLPKERIDSELFGHVRGAFTGATENRPGKVREAVSGTVFMDEIGALPADCWGNLLRFLQDKEIHPVGGKTTIVDVRILAATNQHGLVPQDALHRFDHVLHLPPLRTRPTEIAGLANDFFEAARETANRSSLRFPQAERDELARADYRWPGNIRQLEKAVQRAVLLHSSGRDLTAQKVLDAAKMV